MTWTFTFRVPLIPTTQVVIELQSNQLSVQILTAIPQLSRSSNSVRYFNLTKS